MQDRNNFQFAGLCLAAPRQLSGKNNIGNQEGASRRRRGAEGQTQKAGSLERLPEVQDQFCSARVHIALAAHPRHTMLYNHRKRMSALDRTDLSLYLFDFADPSGQQGMLTHMMQAGSHRIP
jgi:hypothetical protein